MIAIINGKYVASCEVPGCTARLNMTHASQSRVRNSLVHCGWDWILGDEMFDHVCSLHKKDPDARKKVLENSRG